MRLCDGVNKIWLLLSVTVIALMYVIFAINCDLNIGPWQTSRFNFDPAVVGSDYPIRLDDETKKILYWNTLFGDEHFYFGDGDVFKNCPGIARKCWATHERTPYNVEDFDAVLFHGSQLSVDDLPRVRGYNQRYIFVNLESPENRPISDSIFENDYFNRTMTYRLDSDVVWPYADVRQLDDGEVVAPRHEILWSTRLREATDSQGMRKSTVKIASGATSSKSKAAVWFVSNCKSQSGREKYIDELGKYVDVEIFGFCGRPDKCPKESATKSECFRREVEPIYYFYLSFENSMCQDYVTEKLYNILKYNVVPVVYGGANYSRFAPPKSYINALDFESPQALAEYLKKLMREPREYAKYFEWKKYYEIVSPTERVICQLCRYLHSNNESKSYSPLSTWYSSDKCPLQEKLRRLTYLTKSDL